METERRRTGTPLRPSPPVSHRFKCYARVTDPFRWVGVQVGGCSRSYFVTFRFPKFFAFSALFRLNDVDFRGFFLFHKCKITLIMPPFPDTVWSNIEWIGAIITTANIWLGGLKNPRIGKHQRIVIPNKGQLKKKSKFGINARKGRWNWSSGP